MSNVRAEVLRVSRSRTGWKEADHAKNQRPCISSLKSTFETRGDNEATSPRSETPKGNGGSCGGNDMFKPARPAGTKVSSIANMFQSLSPHKEDNIQARTVFAKPETTHVLKKSTESIDLVTTENWKNNSVREFSAPVSGVGGGGTGTGGGGGGVGGVTGNVHLARTESHLARFNNARAMFERLEEKNVTRVKSSCGYNLNLKKRSGSVSPSRSSPTRTNYSSNNSRSPSPGDIQSVGSSPKKDSQLSPREKSWSADNILGVRNRDNSAVVSKFYESSHINGARANMELNLELRESGAGEAIVSPSPLSPGLVNYLIASPLDDDGPVTNGKNGIDSETRSASKANSFAKPLIPPHKPNVNAASLASKMSSAKKEVPKRDESLSPSKRPDLSHKVQELNESDSGLRPRVVSSTPSKGLGSKSSEEKSRSQIPQLMPKETTQKLTNKINQENDGNSGEQGGAALISASSNSLEIVSRQFTSVPPPPPLPPSSPQVSVSEDVRHRGVVKNDEYEKDEINSSHQQLITSSKSNLSHIPATTNTSCEQKQNGVLGGTDSHIPQVAQVTAFSKSTTISNTSKTAAVISSDGTYLNQLCEEENTNYHHAFTNGVASASVTREQLLAAEEASYKEFLLEGLQETVVDPENGSDITASTIADGMSFDWTNSSPELPVESIHAKDEELSSTGESSSPSHSQRWSTGTEELPPSVETSIRLEPTYLKNVSQGTSPLSPSNFLERVENEIAEEETNCVARTSEPEVMTVLEAEQLLSRRLCPELLSDEEANEVKKLLKMESESSRNEADVVASASDEDDVDDSEEDEDDEPQEGSYEIEEGVNYLEDGHFWVEVPGLPDSDEDITDCYNAITMPKKRDRVRFSTQPMKVYSTYSVNDYDRRNDEVDPVSASAEYELEKRVEKMDVFPIELMKGSEGLGLSIIGMGVGADAGLEKLGIFVKTITDGGAAHKDGRINVNDQIIEVDGKSLVGVTQAYAASVLRNTAGLVRFLIGREKDGENSEVAQLISQSLMADRDRDERRRSMELELQRQREEEPREDGHPGLTLPIPSLTLQLPTTPQVIVQEDSTPEEGEDCPTCEVFDLEDDSSDSPSPDSDITNLKIKLKEAQYKNAVAEAEAANTRVKLAMLESVHADQVGSEKRVQMLLDRLTDAEKIVESTKKEIMTYQDMLEESQGQYILLEKKYYKAKKIIKDFQLRQHDLVHREEFHLQQLQEKDQEYNALVKFLKDRVIQLEHDLTETQKIAGLPVRLPYDSNSIKQLQLTPQQIRKPQSLKDQKGNGLVDVSDGECSDGDLTKYDISPISDDAENKTSTVERKPSSKEDVFEKAVPHTELLDNAPAKAKAELACKGSLANRQPPSLKKTGSTGSSSDGMSQDLRDSVSSLNSSHEDLDECNEQILGDKTSFSTSFSSDSSPAVTPLPSESLADDAAALESKRVAHGVLSHTSPLIGKDREGRGSPIRIDDRFAEEMRLILERKTVEVKSKIPDFDSDHLKTDHQLGVDGQRILTPSPGSASTHSSDSNAPSTVDLSQSPPHNQKARSYIKIQGTSSSAKRGALSCPHTDEKAPRGGAHSCYSCCCMLGTARTADSSILEKTSHDFESRHSFEGKNILSHGEHHSALSEKRSYQWHSCSVIEWSTAQVGQWLLALSMEQYISNFMDGNVGGKDLLQVDGAKLKILGVNSGTDRATLKKKIKDLRIQAEKERKAMEKELKTREKMQRKADKAAEKASVKRK